MKDLETVENKLNSLKRAVKSGDKEIVKQYEFCEKLKTALEQGESARTVVPENDTEEKINKDLQLLTAKPVLYLCNVEESAAREGNNHVERVRVMAAQENAGCLHIAVSTESDIAELETYEEKQLFLEELGLEDAGVNRVIRAAYNLLQLQTYFTAGVKEVRAWTIKRDCTAPQAAGVIHTDFENGFIRAEVISFKDYDQYGSENAVKEAGKMRVEGKEYMVQDGDVMHFRFNV